MTTLPEPIRLLAAILDHVGPIPDEWRDQARAIVREANEDPDACITIADIRRSCEALRAQGIEPPWYTIVEHQDGTKHYIALRGDGQDVLREMREVYFVKSPPMNKVDPGERCTPVAIGATLRRRGTAETVNVLDEVYTATWSDGSEAKFVKVDDGGVIKHLPLAYFE